jgi:hypothetical protein
VGADVRKDGWKEVREGFDKWLKLCCYVAGAWFLLDIIKYLPKEVSDRIVEALLTRLGI